MPGQFTGKPRFTTVSYTHLRAHETDSYLVGRLLLEKRFFVFGFFVWALATDRRQPTIVFFNDTATTEIYT